MTGSIVADMNGEEKTLPACERLLTEAQCDKLARTDRQMQRLDGVIHVWVCDARQFAHGKESTVYVQMERLGDPHSSDMSVMSCYSVRRNLLCDVVCPKRHNFTSLAFIAASW